jgi:CheY-like chemotaxis protein
MSKIEVNKLELSPEEFHLEQMLHKLVNVVNYRIEEKHQKVSMHVDDALPPTFVGDDQRLGQVIANLLSNAVKFTPEGGAVSLDARLLEENGDLCLVQIAVRDNGIGISPEQQAHLFTSFQQAENDTARKFGGTGLGIDISKRLVEMMGGSVRIESELGKGATFLFTVRMRRGEGTPLAAEDETFGDRNNSFAGVRLLIAEDVDLNREVIAALLEPGEPDITFAENGEEAVRLFRENPGRYDVIFMDVQMPGMDGFEATRRIRAMTDVPDAGTVPIVAMTANVFREDVEKCLAAGMNDHVGKPVNLEEVLDKLRFWLRR